MAPVACREDRRRERERERRLDARDAHGVKKSKLTRDRERDISEKIALGQANVRATGEAMYDQRLFNQVLLTTTPAMLPYILVHRDMQGAFQQAPPLEVLVW